MKFLYLYLKKADKFFMKDILFYKELEVMANIGWWCFYVETNELIWSDQTYKIHKMPLNEKILVESAINYYVPEHRPIIEAAFKRCLEKHESFNLVLRVENADGEKIWVRSNGKPVIEKNKVIKIFGTFQDIDEQMKVKKDKTSIWSELQRYKDILDEFAIVGETDLRGTIIYANKKFCEISGYKEEELVGKNHRILNSGYHSKEFFKDLWDTVSSGDSWSGRICNMAKDESHYWVETYISPTYNSENIMIGYMSLRFDITERVELQEQVAREQEMAAFSAQLASVGEMSANIAHEIANPLTIIYGRNNTLLKCANDVEKLEKTQQSISGAIERIQKIIKGLKRLSRKSQSDEFELVSLKALVDETLNFSKEALKSNQIELMFDDIHDDIFVECREIEISQVLLNLLSNARDAIIESKTTDKWIKVQFRDKGEHIIFNVSDSGPGIPKENRDKIMESFFTTKKMGKGTGLGLSLASRFLNEHGGSLTLAENTDETTFVLNLPKIQIKK
ncbi:MAG: PAS domain S-box-containing protein [Bacteriovoracaceae bacterium]